MSDTRDEAYTVHCHNCGQQINGCVGKYGDWMHTATHKERCHHGMIAKPVDLLAQLREKDRLAKQRARAKTAV